GATATLIQVERSSALESARTSVAEHLETYEAQVVRAVREIDQTLKSVQYAYDVRGDAEAALADLRDRELLPPDLIFTVRVLDAPDSHGEDGTPVADTLSVAPPRISTDAEAGWRLRFSRPLRSDEGGLAGTAIVEVDVGYFVSGYDASTLGVHGVLAVLGTDGVFRALRTGDDVSAGRRTDIASLMPEQALAEPEVLRSSNDWDDVRRYTSARQLFEYPLAVVVGVSEAERLAAADADIDEHLARAGGASLILVLLIGALGRSHWKLVRARERESEAEVAHARRVRHLAFHDNLTGLPNRALLSRLLEQNISEARRFQRHLGVYFFDLDGFKDVNDTLGHDAGDELLRQVANRLDDALRESDIVARMGGDEFVVVAPDVGVEGGSEALARKILTALREPFEVMGRTIRVTGSVGAALYPEHGEDEQTLMKHADIAMYEAKEAGKNDFRFYSEAMGAGSAERLALAASLRRALENREFDLHYQARRDMESGRVTGVEALLRWHHPELGTVAPLQFIPLAEEIGLIVPIGRWVLETACRQNVAWQAEGKPRVAIAVNLTARQFLDSNLIHDIRSVLDRTGMDAELLELEISENVLTRDVSRSVEILDALKELGVKITIDNFGTGYSSLAVLKRFPLDSIKVDRIFIQDSSRNRMERDVTDAILMMGRALSPSLHAQGVETREQVEYLRVHACDEVQGYYFDRPVAARDADELFEASGAAAGSAGADR
ncbi:MAG: putative bifunctional diguanylate cyclase/phosphodiesterase, partial [Gemmatimonadota bacterium]